MKPNISSSPSPSPLASLNKFTKEEILDAKIKITIYAINGLIYNGTLIGTTTYQEIFNHPKHEACFPKTKPYITIVKPIITDTNYNKVYKYHEPREIYHIPVDIIYRVDYSL